MVYVPGIREEPGTQLGFNECRFERSAALASLAAVFMVGRVKKQKKLNAKSESLLPQTYKS